MFRAVTNTLGDSTGKWKPFREGKEVGHRIIPTEGLAGPEKSVELEKQDPSLHLRTTSHQISRWYNNQTKLIYLFLFNC